MQICTIVARNYLAAARVLARSFAEHDPGGTCWTLVIDDVEEEIDDDDEPFEVVRPAELAIDRWEEMVVGYDVLELSTAVKPWLVRHLLERRSAERVTYLDPDIEVFSSLAEVDELLRDHALVVNPHLTDPLPRDGRRPTETEILASGSFNLGFAGFASGPETSALLDWWAQRLATDCLVDPERGLFVDQRWMDFAPGLVGGLHVLRDPGYNLAYWNLPGREITRAGDGYGYAVNGRPLRFVHFSGYDPDVPDRLSTHQDRTDLASTPLLRELCDGYAAALTREGHEQWRERPYAFGRLPDGTPLTRPARRAYRDGVTRGLLAPGPAFTPDGGRRLTGFLRGPADVGGRHGVSRFLHALWESRADLRDSFPDLAGADGPRLAAWAEITPGEVPPAMIGEGAPGPPGVAVSGYFTGVMGVGEHARQLAGALQAGGVPVSTVTLRPDAAPVDESLAVDSGGRSAGHTWFNLLCANAEMVPSVAESLGPGYFAGRYTIGFWAWEVSAFPTRYLSAFAPLDEVWVGSRHVRDAVADVATVPVIAIPQPVSLPAASAQAPAPVGMGDGFRFLFVFDYLSVFERKNPLATIEAFARAFPAGAGASLTVKTLNDDHDPMAHRRVLEAAGSHPDVHLVTERLDARGRDGLMNAADCYVSLHRAEGFGYTMAESMWAGKPVIATGYSGNLDYMTPDNSYLVDHRLVAIGPGHDPYPESGIWAEPDVAHAARLMREVFDDREAATRRGERAAADIRAGHGPQAAGRAMTERLALLLEHASWRSMKTDAARPRPLRTDWLEGMISSGPVPPAGGGRFGRPQAIARRGLLRALKPVTVHERLVDSGLLQAVERLDANLRSLGAAHDAGLRRIDELRDEVARLRREPPPDD
jgi:glycosyltransferase involved in cell wall biosynthesis